MRFEKISTLVDPAVNLAGCEILEADKVFTLLLCLQAVVGVEYSS